MGTGKTLLGSVTIFVPHNKVRWPLSWPFRWYAETRTRYSPDRCGHGHGPKFKRSFWNKRRLSRWKKTNKDIILKQTSSILFTHYIFTYRTVYSENDFVHIWPTLSKWCALKYSLLLLLLLLQLLLLLLLLLSFSSLSSLLSLLSSVSLLSLFVWTTCLTTCISILLYTGGAAGLGFYFLWTV